MPNALNKGAGSEASLPVTLRVRRRAPKLLFPQDSVMNLFFWETAFSSPPQVRFPLRRSKSRDKSISPRRERKGGRKALPYGSYDHRIASTVPLVFSS